jgi:hypothetical protein
MRFGLVGVKFYHKLHKFLVRAIMMKSIKSRVQLKTFRKNHDRSLLLSPLGLNYRGLDLYKTLAIHVSIYHFQKYALLPTHFGSGNFAFRLVSELLLLNQNV